MKRHLLIIDDEENMCHMLTHLLSEGNYDVSTANNGKNGLEIIKSQPIDIIFCDLKMPIMDGLQFLVEIQKKQPDIPVIMMSAYATIDTAVKAMKNGAYDFITKPFKREEILLTLKRAEESTQLKTENKLLKEKIKELELSTGFSTVIAQDKDVIEIIKTAQKVAKHDATILITGESGTGKEVFASSIHLSSPRKHKQFVAVNCGSIPSKLLESEFFGHLKGSFTGAVSNKIGLFDQAKDGTIFLDEIGELPIDLQVKFLRVLQEQEVRPIGALKTHKTNIRIIAATSKDLLSLVKVNSFREDLFYRLNVINLHLPPLRDRKEDIPALASLFIKQMNKKYNLSIKTITSDAIQFLSRQPWPGNIRELKNSIERAAIINDTEILDVNCFSRSSLPKSTDITPDLPEQLGTLSLKQSKKIIEKNLIKEALQVTSGNKRRAATLLEISYPALLQKIRTYKLS